MGCNNANISMPVGPVGECDCSDVIQAVFDGTSFTPPQYDGKDFDECALIEGSSEDMKITLSAGTYMAELNLQIHNKQENVLYCIKQDDVVIPESAGWSNEVNCASVIKNVSMRSFTDIFTITSSTDIEGCTYVNCEPKHAVLTEIARKILRIYKV